MSGKEYTILKNNECIQAFSKIVEATSKLQTICEVITFLNNSGNGSDTLDLPIALNPLILHYVTEIRCIAESKIK